METLLSGSSYYYAAVVMETQVFQTMAADVEMITIVVYGLSFFFSSAAADVAETVDVSNLNVSKWRRIIRRLFLFPMWFFVFEKSVHPYVYHFSSTYPNHTVLIFFSFLYIPHQFQKSLLFAKSFAIHEKNP